MFVTPSSQGGGKTFFPPGSAERVKATALRQVLGHDLTVPSLLVGLKAVALMYTPLRLGSRWFSLRPLPRSFETRSTVSRLPQTAKLQRRPQFFNMGVMDTLDELQQTVKECCEEAESIGEGVAVIEKLSNVRSSARHALINFQPGRPNRFSLPLTLAPLLCTLTGGDDRRQHHQRCVGPG